MYIYIYTYIYMYVYIYVYTCIGIREEKRREEMLFIGIQMEDQV